MANVYKIIYRHDILDINSCFETPGAKTMQHETLMPYALNKHILKYNGHYVNAFEQTLNSFISHFSCTARWDSSGSKLEENWAKKQSTVTLT